MVPAPANTTPKPASSGQTYTASYGGFRRNTGNDHDDFAEETGDIDALIQEAEDYYPDEVDQIRPPRREVNRQEREDS